jgi:ferredoxin
MAKYKIIFNRNICIGAAACEAQAPRFWEIDKEDGKANLKGGVKVAHEVFELEISEEFFKEALNSSEVCPVEGCIRVVKIEKS